MAGEGGTLIRLILDPCGCPHVWRGHVSTVQDGRGSRCPRGPGVLRFDGQPKGWVSANGGTR